MLGRGWVITVAATGVAALLAVHFLLLHTYWDYSEGVYALTAHQMLHGADLYGQMVGAQPPGVFLTGAALLAIHTSVEWLRFGVGCLQLIAGLIAARIVFRVTGNRLATVLTPALMLLTPWAVHEHGALTPEMVALPAMLGAALLAASPRTCGAAGVLCAVMVLTKFPLAIPAVAVVLVAADRRRAATWGALALVAGLGATWALGGSGFWRDTVIAQMHSGSRTLGELKGFWAQAGWNVLGLLFCAAAALVLRRDARDRRMLTISAALAIGNLITFLSNFKEGTGLNITVPVEAALVPLAMAGTVFSVRAARAWPRPRPQARAQGRPQARAQGRPQARAQGRPQARTQGRPQARPRARGSGRRGWIAAACGAGLAFTVAQSVSLIATPHNPIPFLRAFSAPAWEISMTAPQFDAAVLNADRCPAGEAYGGPPLIALQAHRLLPAGQPDEFLPSHSVTLAAVNAQITAVKAVCPLSISPPAG